VQLADNSHPGQVVDNSHPAQVVDNDGSLSPQARAETGGPTGASGAAAAPGRFQPQAEPDAYASLIAESVRLERMLGQLRGPPRVMSAGTAGTIAGLEDRIALVDEQLTFAAGRNVDPRQRAALWRERVDVMNALLQVRYAQSEGNVF
jgi:hypothetical protein